MFNVLPTKHLRLLCFLILILYIIKINASKYDDSDDEYVDVGVRLVGGKRDSLIADLIAEERNVINSGHIDGVNLFHYQIRQKRGRRSKRAIEQAIEDLKRDERVEYVMVAERVHRQKRNVFDEEQLINLLKKNQQEKKELKNVRNIDTSHLKMSFIDPLYPEQWYLENAGQLDTRPENDINAVPAWTADYTGKGVVITIVDDGLDHLHGEIARRYRPDLSFDLNDLNDTKHDPLPGSYDGVNSHGTECAGAAAGEANNDLCGVGVAFEAWIAGIRVLDGPVTTLLEARALTMFSPDTHIKSASWGPMDDGTTMEAPGSIVNAALDYSVKHGRNGKGTIFVWASGNGGTVSDDCGADGYVSHQNIISIGSINHNGKTTYFSEACPSTLAVAYTGGRHSATEHEKTLSIGVVTSDVAGKCTTSFFGTSAAAPIAAGAFALLLEANPELGYRDVMHIVARTARIPSVEETDGWIINGAGFHVNDKFGFGALDVAQMTALAQKWVNVEPRYECYYEYKNDPIKLDLGTVAEVSLDVLDCKNVEGIEHVVANISYNFHRRGDVKITLISPSKTPSELLSFRDNDATDKGIKQFPFLTAHKWGENPIGTWTLRIETREPQDIKSKQSALLYEGLSEVSHFGLRIYGTKDHDNKHDFEKREKKMAYVPTQNEIESIYKKEFEKRESPNVMEKREYDHLKARHAEQKQTKKSLEVPTFIGLIRRVFGF